jgi:hypothetical protein
MREVRYETAQSDRSVTIKRIKVGEVNPFSKTGACYADIVDELMLEEDPSGSFTIYMDHSAGDPDSNRWSEITIRREDALTIFEWLGSK